MLKSSSAARACSLAALLLLAASGEAALTGREKLAAVYDSILSARFDRADAELASTCPPAPAEACKVLLAVSTWWRIQIDPDNRSRDRLLNDRAKAAEQAADAWTERDPKNAEAWFYLAGSYAPLVQWQVLRGERLGAARNGNRIREALERALQIDPTMADAHFGIGVYEYYADVAPGAAKVVRWLMFLPGGDRVKGLQAIDTTRRSGDLFRGEADFQRYVIDIWYEHKPDEALAILRSLDARYPNNPLFLQRVAETYNTYLHDTRASADAWQTLIDRAARDQVYDAARIRELAQTKRRALF
jgi:hypothetical protein